MAPLKSFFFAAFAWTAFAGSIGYAQTPSVSATQTDSANPVNGQGRTSPGGTITYTIEINNSGAGAANGVTLTNPTPAHTTLVPGSLQTSCLAFPDAYDCLGNVSITIPAPGVLGNDIDPDGVGPALTATPISGATAQGGSISLSANGGFTYDPPAGFNGSDTFTYTLNDNEGNTDTAVLTINVSGMIWFINANAGTNGNGRLSSPFNNLASFQAINNGTGNNPKAGHSIFLYESANDYTGGITLLEGQRLIGQDATSSLATLAGVTPPTGSASLPAMNSGGAIARVVNAAAGGSGVTLGLNCRLHGFTAGNANSFAITGTNVGTIQVSDVTINTTGAALNLGNCAFNAGSAFASITSTGGATGVSLASVTGTAALGAGSLSGHSSNSISISGGSGSATYSGNVTKTSGTGAAVAVSGKTGGSVTLSGLITATGVAGVSLGGNSTSTTILFSGGLALSSVANAAFTATNGGTVTVTGTNNTLATTTAVALNVTDTTIAAAGLNFRSVSCNGAANGIVLNNTGTTGGVAVTGDGNTSVGGNNSGGTIQNTTGHGIHLVNTRSPSFTNMRILNTFRSGVFGRNVTNFTFHYGSIDKSGLNASNNPVDTSSAANGVSNIAFNTTASGDENNLSGTVVIEGNSLTNAWYHGVEIFNYAGTIADITISNNNITTPTSDTQTMGHGISLIAYGGPATVASITRGTIHGNTITNVRGGVAIQVQGGNSNSPSAPSGSYGTPGHATNVIAITNNTISGQSAANPTRAEGIVALVGGVGQGNFNISNNQITHTTGISLSSSAFGNAIVTETIHNNTIVSNNSFASMGIGVGTSTTGGFPTNSPRLTTTITNNNISQTEGNGILVVARDASDGRVVAKINHNVVAAPLAGVRPGIRVDAGNNTGDNDVELEIAGNTSAGSGSDPSTRAPGIGLRKQGTSTTVNAFGIEGLSPSPAGTPAVESHVNALNPNSASGGSSGGGIGGTLLISASSGFTSATVPMLFAPTEIAEEIDARDAFEGGESSDRAFPPMPEIPAEVGARETSAPELPGSSDEVGLTAGVLARHAEVALEQWKVSGLRPEQVALLEAVRFELADLTDRYLAEFKPGLVRVDRDAAGNGWHLRFDLDGDPASRQDRLLHAGEQESVAADRVDLLTVLMHEMGHALGLCDTYSPLRRHSVMYGFLTVGERRLPRRGEAADAVPHGHHRPHYLSAPLSIGVLPPGKSIRVTFQVVVDDPTAVTQVSSQGTVSGSNFANVLTNDPDTGAPNDATITPVEQPPSVTDVSANGFEDTPLNFTAGQFTGAFSDPNGDSLARIRVTSLPANGILRVGAAPVAVNDEILAANLGNLNFLPAANFNGPSSFGWTASDGNGFALTPALVNITIVAVNDAPTLDAIPNPAAILEDAGQQTVNLSGITAGGGETQTLTVTASSNNALLIPNPVSVTYASPAATGTLQYTPLGNAHGTATITVTVQDNGGTANGGVDLFTQQFTVVVNPVADTPSITDATTLPNTQTTSGLVISRNPADGAEVTHFQITNIQNGALFQNNGITAIPAGSFITFAEASAGLKFTPATDFQGDATFQIQASTSNAVGGLGGGVATATIAVNEVVSIDTSNPGDDEAAEGGVNNGIFTFTRGGSVGELVAHFVLDSSSTASAADFTLSGGSVDYNAGAGTGTVTFPDGQTAVQVILGAVPEAPDAAEAAETVRLDLVPVALPNPGAYLVGTPDNATVTILQNGFTVTNGNDSGEGSLRQAVLNANAIAGADTIAFAGDTFTDANVPDVVELTGGMVDIASDLTLSGLGADVLIVRNTAAAGPASRVFNVASGSTVVMRGMTITGGNSINGGGIVVEGGATSLGLLHCVVTDNTAASAAGGIAAGPGSTLDIVHSTISNNTANGSGGGGGIDFDGATLRVVNSTISGNRVPNGSDNGAGIWTQAGTTTLINSTITGNLAGGAGSAGGLLAFAGSTVTVGNSIIAANQNNGTIPDVAGAAVLTSHGGNLVGNVGAVTAFDQPGDQTGTGAAPLDPLLGPLAGNGGPTPTHALLPGSPALNAGLNANIPADTFDLDGDSDTAEPVPFDQRGPGFTRAIGTVDAGAYELQKSVSITALDAAKAEGSGAGTTSFTFTVARTGPTDGPVAVDYAVTGATAAPADAADFGGSLPSGQVTIPDTQSSVVLTIDVSRDALVEPGEGFTVTLSNPDNGYIVNGATAGGTIQNDDSATLTLTGGISVNEGAAGTTGMLFTATLDNPVQGGFSVVYATSDGTATAGDGDYQDNDGSLVFTGSAGEQRGFTVLVNGDDKVEADETFAVALGAVTGGHGAVSTAGSPQTGTITNDDSAVVSLAGNVSQSEATSPQTFTVTLSNPVDIDVTVDYATSDGTAVAPGDYTAASGTLTFPAGTTTAQTVGVVVIDDGEVEADEVFNLTLDTLSAPSRDVSLGTSTATGTILNEDIFTVTISAIDDSSDENAADTGTWRVSRGGTFGDLVVGLEIDPASTASAADWTQAGASFVSTAPGGLGTVVIPDGALFVDIVLTPVDDLAAEADETVTLNVTTTGTYLVGASPARTVTIARNDFGVTNTDDSGEGSLRQAVENANLIPGDDTVTFEGPVFADAAPDTIVLGGTELEIAEAAMIAGPGAALLAISGNGASRIFSVSATTGEVAIRGMTLTDGHAVGVGNAGSGGAVFKDGAASNLVLEGCHLVGNAADTFGGGVTVFDGSATIRDCTLSGNVANDSGPGGGGLHNVGTLTVVNSTISGNDAPNATSGGGGGILNTGTLQLLHSTVTGNRANAAVGGGGIWAQGTETFRNSLVAGNFEGAGTDPSDIDGGMIDTAIHTLVGDAGTSGGLTDGVDGNLVGNGGSGTIDPSTVLDPVLANRGGVLPVHALVVGSPAIDAGDPAFDETAFAPPLSTDLRGLGFARVAKGLATSATAAVDIGAYELFAAPEFTNAALRLSVTGDPLDLATATGATPPGGTFSGPGVSGGLFDPRALAPGVYTLTYTVQDAFGVGNSATFTVTVLAIPTKLVVQKPKRFAPTEVGKRSRTQRIKITNRGGLPATGLRLVLKGAGRADFKVVRPAKRQLAAGATTTFQASFRPRKAGNRKATVSVLSSAAPVKAVLLGRGKSSSDSLRDPDRLKPKK